MANSETPVSDSAPARRGGAPLPVQAAPAPNPTMATYASISLLLAAFCAMLWMMLRSATADSEEPNVVIGPIVALVGLTGVVWLLMVLLRNYAILRGLSSAQYYVDYKSYVPDEWIERPARTFNNLMQVPILFYALCILMLVTNKVDGGQLMLAWTFVATRVAHALVYIALNRVPYRFACWIAGCITLGVLWVRFAEQTWHTW
jgi:hypothetical protein